MITPAPHVIPAPPVAAELVPAPAVGPPTHARARTPVPPVVVVAVVAVFSLVALALAAFILPRPTGIAAATSSLGPTSGSAATTSPTPAAAPTGRDGSTLAGQGSAVAEFAFADSTGIATITNEGSGAFAVWTVGADGARQNQLVDAVGPYVGTRRFAAHGGAASFAVESEGAWSIKLEPISAARTWNASGRLVGDGDDVVLVFPATTAAVPATVISDGAVAISAYAGGSRQPVVDEPDAFRGDVDLPAGTTLLEIQSESAWSIAGP